MLHNKKLFDWLFPTQVVPLEFAVCALVLRREVILILHSLSHRSASWTRCTSVSLSSFSLTRCSAVWRRVLNTGLLHCEWWLESKLRYWCGWADFSDQEFKLNPNWFVCPWKYRKSKASEHSWFQFQFNQLYWHNSSDQTCCKSKKSHYTIHTYNIQ